MINTDKNIIREIEQRIKNGEDKGEVLMEYEYNDCEKCDTIDLSENLYWSEYEWEEITDEEYEKIYRNPSSVEPQTEYYDVVCDSCWNDGLGVN